MFIPSFYIATNEKISIKIWFSANFLLQILNHKWNNFKTSISHKVLVPKMSQERLYNVALY